MQGAVRRAERRVVEGGGVVLDVGNERRVARRGGDPFKSAAIFAIIEPGRKR